MRTHAHLPTRLLLVSATCLLLTGLLQAAPPAGPSVDQAGVVEKQVMAGLPSVYRMSPANLLTERRLREHELADVVGDLTEFAATLPVEALADTAHAPHCPVKSRLVGLRNRKATLEVRLDAVRKELVRRGLP